MINKALDQLGLAALLHNQRWPSAIINQQPYYDTHDLCSLQSPIDGSNLYAFHTATPTHIDTAIHSAHQAFEQWRLVPAPRRGELIRAIAQQVALHKVALAELITLETGKIASEALGEVQEWLDICDFSLGLSRQLYGLTMASERPAHRLQEQWHPLGVVGIITAFNFPIAVWAWNAMLALVCGNSVVWKPSEKTPLCALACLLLVNHALASLPEAPIGLVQLLQGKHGAGMTLADDRRISLLSATGSTAMGKALAPRVATRLGRCLLELGGNNAAIISPSALLEQALSAVVFAAVGTCGQRCTSLRRLFVHHSCYDEVLQRLTAIYQQIHVGDPRHPNTLVGPLIDHAAFSHMQEVLQAAQAQGGTLLTGGDRLLSGELSKGYYVRPALISIREQSAIVHVETFAPILYVLPYHDFERAVALNNAVSQGLSSALFSQNIQEAEYFLSAAGSDCGIANINTGTSGAEIGGAFGGEKDTGGGRESGSDAWKNYMRRATNTINYGVDLPLAQGVQFLVD